MFKQLVLCTCILNTLSYYIQNSDYWLAFDRYTGNWNCVIHKKVRLNKSNFIKKKSKTVSQKHVAKTPRKTKTTGRAKPIIYQNMMGFFKVLKNNLNHEYEQIKK